MLPEVPDYVVQRIEALELRIMELEAIVKKHEAVIRAITWNIDSTFVKPKKVK